MLPFEDIPDDVIPLTAYMKELLTKATKEVPLLICLDSVDQLVGSQDGNKMSWLPTKIPPYCKIIVSCTREEGNENLNKDYELLRQMICKEENFLEVTALGEKLAWNVVKLWNCSKIENKYSPSIFLPVLLTLYLLLLSILSPSAPSLAQLA